MPSRAIAFVLVTSFAAPLATVAAEPLFSIQEAGLVKKYCFDCHSNAGAEGQINFEQLAAEESLGKSFKRWEKAAAAVESGKMPPADATQPSETERKRLVAAVRGELARLASEKAGDPGVVALRRLTSAEFAHAIGDLTGLDLDLEREFVSDAAGGEGFTNVGTVQFLDDAGLSRYLEAAKKVAAHAVVGSGGLAFFSDPGQTGLELSAIHRVRQIYREHGFRTAAGEGGKPFGLDRYPKAFFAAWRFLHRERLGKASGSLEEAAAEEGLSPAFVRQVWEVVTREDLVFPAAEIAARWKRIPAPPESSDQLIQARAACEELYAFMSDMQVRLAKAVGDEEEAAVLSEGAFQVEAKQAIVARFPWMDPPKKSRVEFSVVSGDPSRSGQAIVVWKNARMRYRRVSRRRDELEPLAKFLRESDAAAFHFGEHPAEIEIGGGDFVTVGEASRSFAFEVPEGVRGIEIQVEVELDLARGEDSVVRCTILEDGEEGVKPKTISTLLADPSGSPFKAWRAGVVEFARLLPQVSHREGAPSDRDPIPFPFLNTYNLPERNFFHTGVKYHRDDEFFVRYLLDHATRQRLDEAWTDLLTSFEYHDILVRFAAEKYKLDLGERRVGELNDAWIDQQPGEIRDYLRRQRNDFVMMQGGLRQAEPGHVEDVLGLAARAWRRELTPEEQASLRAYYSRLRGGQKLDHVAAVRAMIARVLVAPEFLYRAERSAAGRGGEGTAAEKAGELSDWELASRLSFLIWSSVPDEELRWAAEVGELRDTTMLAQQARRMLKDEKAKRFAEEFFGQWLGFYQFDRFRGIDGEKFPEFNESLKTALHGEANRFFDYIVRENRPVSEILFADYGFLNAELAKHYGMERSGLTEELCKVVGVAGEHRGGLMGLGAVLAVTSAPLRTSPVKRGDWILRRVLDTPVPPPPANAGSIAADESPADGKSVRQRLEVHRHDAACVNCHSRIDPLGFALERYDLLGRWRETYRNGEPIDDALAVAGGEAVHGPDGLRQVLKARQEQFYRTLCGKLLAYSLGRSEVVSDRQLIERMLADAKGGEGNVADLMVEIVSSKQFRNRSAGGSNALQAKSAAGED